VQIGDLIRIKDESGIVYGTGLYLRAEYTWKNWHCVLVDGKEYKFDEPFWELEIVNKKEE